MRCDLAGPLRQFFEDLVADRAEREFHPHPLTGAEATRIANYAGPDLYYSAVQGTRVLGYGLLRGWEQGYDVPSLGIALHPSARGTGLGRTFMHFLHAAARQRGARRVRLKVYAGNTLALGLYRSLGYHFEGEEAGQFVGYFELNAEPHSVAVQKR